MENVYIKTDDFDAEITVDSDKIFGFKFYKDNNVEAIDESIIKYFTPFLCSNNRIKLETELDYDVYLDNNTMFKHYFKNDIEDFSMFFKNNGESIVCYLEETDNKDDVKKFKVILDRFYYTVIASGVGLAIIMGSLSVGVLTKKIDRNYARDFFMPSTDQIEYADVESKIYSSPNLSLEEKQFLSNKNFIEDMLKYKNDSTYLKYVLNKRLTEMDIRSYDSNDEMYNISSGYYTTKNKNVLFVANYDGLTPESAEVVAHENVHLWQYESGYNLLIESTAEILAYEYFDTPLNSYNKQVKLTQMLMEIIGAEPILKYVITNDFRDIENRVKPYLNKDEYQLFLNCLSFNRNKDNSLKYETFKEILKILYKNIYGSDFADDEIIKALESNNEIVRYYFNERKVSDEYSYYIFKTNINNEMFISFDEAEKKGLLNFYVCMSKVDMNYEDGQKMMQEPKDNTYEIVIEKKVFLDVLSRDDNGKHIYYSSVNGEIISNSDEQALKDELIKRGYGQYSVSYLLPVNYNEYKNNPELKSKELWKKYHSGILDMNQELLYYNELVEEEHKVYLPTVNDRNRPFDELSKIK